MINATKYPPEPRTECALMSLNVKLEDFFAGDYSLNKRPLNIATRCCAASHDSDPLCLEGKKQRICNYKFKKSDLALKRPENFTYGGQANA